MQTRHVSLFTAAVATAVVLAGGVAAALLPVSATTLQKSDFPSGFDVKASQRLTQAARKIPGSLAAGYVTGWQRSFVRVKGLNSVAATSSTIEYADHGAAHRSLQSIWRNVQGHTGAKRIVIGRNLGYEARAFVYSTSVGVTTYAIAWRYKNIDATVLLVGLRSVGVTADWATRLALAQQRHIRAERG